MNGYLLVQNEQVSSHDEKRKGQNEKMRAAPVMGRSEDDARAQTPAPKSNSRRAGRPEGKRRQRNYSEKDGCRNVRDGALLVRWRLMRIDA